MVAADVDGRKSSPLVALLAGGIAGGIEAACEILSLLLLYFIYFFAKAFL